MPLALISLLTEGTLLSSCCGGSGTLPLPRGLQVGWVVSAATPLPNWIRMSGVRAQERGCLNSTQVIPLNTCYIAEDNLELCVCVLLQICECVHLYVCVCGRERA